MQEMEDLQRFLQAMTAERDTALSSGKCEAAAAQHAPLPDGAREARKLLHSDTAGEELVRDAAAQVKWHRVLV